MAIIIIDYWTMKGIQLTACDIRPFLSAFFNVWFAEQMIIVCF